DKRDYSLAIISKSGTTTEPAISFRFLKTHLIKKYGISEARNRIIAITDSSNGALRELADQEDITSFVIPNDVGGRYSVLSPIGLLPIAVAGFNIDDLLKGAKAMKEFILNPNNSSENPAVIYAATRNALYKGGFTMEIMANYEPKLYYLVEWWKQLFGESEGKDNKGIFPSGVNFTTDLHSMGQYIQDGPRTIFETVISVEKSNKKLQVPFDDANLDNLNYLAGKSVSSVNLKAEIATSLAHVDGGVPNIRICIPEISECVLGELIYFFEFACALSAYTLGVNPFDQPGVEAYKKNMFALLGRPGCEKETKQIKKRLE
ncbi:MAG: glucose-6-phosphate isomerase, partial [Bacteroidetes bacterium]|nr:glucose-6-phosphate isomerase [Bacteroidota bacterium]